MGKSKKAEQRRHARELRKELKTWQRQMVKNGCDKGLVVSYLKEFREILEQGSRQRIFYEEARGHLMQAGEIIRRLLESMDRVTPEERNSGLIMLTEHLERVYHICLIQTEDMDYKSTLGGIRQMSELLSQERDAQSTKIGRKKRLLSGETGKRDGDAAESSAALREAERAGMSEIMLRSELENMKSILDEAAGWSMPDFFALACYLMHEPKETLQEMENERRNACVAAYLKEHFMQGFLRDCQKTGAEDAAERMQELIQTYM